MLRRQDVGRTGKDEHHPGNNWHPLSDEIAEDSVQRKWPVYLRFISAPGDRQSAKAKANAERPTSNAEHRIQKRSTVSRTYSRLISKLFSGFQSLTTGHVPGFLHSALDVRRSAFDVSAPNHGSAAPYFSHYLQPHLHGPDLGRT